jgi:hypothetical protein
MRSYLRAAQFRSVPCRTLFLSPFALPSFASSLVELRFFHPFPPKLPSLLRAATARSRIASRVHCFHCFQLFHMVHFSPSCAGFYPYERRIVPHGFSRACIARLQAPVQNRSPALGSFPSVIEFAPHPSGAASVAQGSHRDLDQPTPPVLTFVQGAHHHPALSRGPCFSAP